MATNDLITLQEYKDYQQIAQTKDDVKISFTITSVSNLIKAYIGTTINDDTPITETISLDYDTNVFYTSQWPIREIVSITEWDRYTYDSTVHVPLTGDVDYYQAGDAIYRVKQPGGFASWSVGPGAVTITYIAGYDEVPQDIKLATIELVAYYVKEEFKQSKTIMGTTTVNSYAVKDGTMPSHIRTLLDSYKIL